MDIRTKRTNSTARPANIFNTFSRACKKYSFIVLLFDYSLNARKRFQKVKTHMILLVTKWGDFSRDRTVKFVNILFCLKNKKTYKCWVLSRILDSVWLLQDPGFNVIKNLVVRIIY